jgi:phage terminase large subunit-like protein
MKQLPFINSVLESKTNENWLIAANRSGKSDAGAFCGASLARFGADPRGVYAMKGSTIQIKDRATAGWVSALDFPTSRDVIQPKYFDNGFVPPGATHEPFIPEWEIEEWRQGDQILKLKNGSIVGFKSAESGRTKYQGAEKEWIHFDEEHPKGIYEEAVIRVGARPLNIFHTVTILPPEGVVGGASWIFGDVIKPWRAGELKGTALFGASIYDNPHIPELEIARLEAIYPEGSLQRRIRLNGEWLPGMGGTRAYGNFNSVLHVIEQGVLLPRIPLVLACDFNVDPMAWVVGQHRNGVFHVHSEITDEGEGIGSAADVFIQRYPQHRGPIWIYGDSTSKGRSRQSGVSDYKILLNTLSAHPSPIEMKVPETNPNVVDRVNALNYAMKNERGQINLEVDPSCKDLIDDLEQVLADPKGGIKKVANRKDPYSRRTHWSDALGYWVSYVAPVRNVSVPKRTMVHIRRLGIANGWGRYTPYYYKVT